jgi:hypothetical protein
MIVYEITADVNGELVRKFEAFMREKHIPDLLETGYFESAEIAKSSEELYRIRYLTKDLRTLEKYFETDAERLRAAFQKEFPAGIEVSREILEILFTSA